MTGITCLIVSIDYEVYSIYCGNMSIQSDTRQISFLINEKLKRAFFVHNVHSICVVGFLLSAICNNG